MMTIVTVYIECFVDGAEIKYEFNVNSEDVEKMLNEYRDSVNTITAFKLDYFDAGHKETMIISGSILCHSTLRVEV